MEVTRRLILIALAAALEFGSTSGDIMVQPGYATQSPKFVNPRIKPPTEPIVQPGYEENRCKAGASHENPIIGQRQSTLNDEIQRNRNLQQIVASQLYNMGYPVEPPQFQQMPVAMIPAPIYLGSPHIFPQSPYYSSNYQHSIAPSGVRGKIRKKYGWGRAPLLLGGASPNQNCVGKKHFSRSIDAESGVDSRLGELHAVATKPSLIKNNISEVVELPVSEIEPADDLKGDKFVEPRQIGALVDRVVSSQLDKIPIENPNQRNPIVSTPMTSQMMDMAKMVGHQIVKTISPMVGASQNGQQQSSQKPYSTERVPQSGTATYPTLNNAENGATGSKRINAGPYDYENRQANYNFVYDHDNEHGYHRGNEPFYPYGYQPNYSYGYQPVYHPNYQPGYQSAYDDHYGRSSIENNKNPRRDRASSSYSSSHPSGSSSSAASSSSSNNNNFHQSPYLGSSNVAYSPYRTATFLDQYGRTIAVSLIPSNGYSKNVDGSQLPTVYEQSRKYY